MKKKKIYTKKGDFGETSLLYGGRVSKNSLRCRAYGDVDEAGSFIGMARAQCKEKDVIEILSKIQKELFQIGGELATDPRMYEKYVSNFPPVTSEMVKELENIIDNIEEKIEIKEAFVIAGTSVVSSILDVARAIVRRSERSVLDLHSNHSLPNEEVIKYLNRLSDLLWILGRYADKNRKVEIYKS